MIKRATWFVSGMAAGVAGTGYAKRKVRAKVKGRFVRAGDQLAPARVARTAVHAARSTSTTVVDAVREGRLAMRAKERELRARREQRVEAIEDRLEPGDQILVDGYPVETARVIVLKPAEERTSRRRRRRTS